MVCHGTVAKRLGLDVAIQAIHQLRNEALDIRLHVIGAGDSLAEARELAAKLKLNAQITFQGMVPLEQLPPLLREASVGLVPNLASNATHLMLPVKLLEYATLGIPVIAARLRTIEHYFTDAVRFFEPGNSVDLAQALRDLHDHPARRDELAHRAALIGARLSQTQRQDYWNAVDSLLEMEDSPLCNLANR